jgi:hypothetical protein
MEITTRVSWANRAAAASGHVGGGGLIVLRSPWLTQSSYWGAANVEARVFQSLRGLRGGGRLLAALPFWRCSPPPSSLAILQSRNRHRVFRNGVWVWVYGPGYTSYGDDCYWLRRQAIITGSPYWWDRYNACVGYDYY